MANQVLLTGRLTKDPELKMTNSNIPVCSINLAVERIGAEGADFIPVVFWRKTAETVANHLIKGSKILVQGRISQRTYENDGKTIYIYEVVGDRMEFLDSKNQSHGEQVNQSSSTTTTTDETYHEMPKGTDDLPF